MTDSSPALVLDSPVSVAADPASTTVNFKLVLLALAMGGFAIGTTEFAAMSLLPYFSAGLGIDEPTAGHVISAYALGVVVGAPILAVFFARMSRRTLAMGLMAVFAIANVLSALSPSYHWMLLFRFLSGLPHGAYFGVAALMAASLVPVNRRAWAVGRVMLGLSIATVIGVPFATWLGQNLGWRWGFGVTGILATITFLMIMAFAPKDPPRPGATPLRELSALKNRQVWLTLGIGAVGFGGLFAVYSYIASTLLEVTGVAPFWVPVVLTVFGMGMTCGTLIGSWGADRALMPTAGILLLSNAIFLAIFPFFVMNVWILTALVFLIGCTGGLGTVLQTRLMDVAQDAQTLAAALNHSAFNVANALGPWLAGMSIAAGYGFASSGFVGSALALGGLLIWAIAVWDARRSGT
ncbi:MFS transporter [Pseudochrobactrum sp. sp1633]|uniref:MFS transporter n=1 Tax=Pseudochrobactrum sp. sp1633 TaxID=3036706 RepID=UPI0025A5F926|nr:MFS transporter [Pseudochrobactrum sp. sp1633]MDM8344089.1 MFS transporter [Pseudochrobactrum sp. sp1633]HWD12063.1 MFS transporter [Pseudochrobactrum sp.]